MSNPLTRAMLEQQGARVYLVPCTVTATSPLTVTLMGRTGVLGVKIAGATYGTGAANALVVSPGAPIILPIG
jgi:hypothetical protein